MIRRYSGLLIRATRERGVVLGQRTLRGVAMQDDGADSPVLVVWDVAE
jgi:hypothetical protein